MRNLIKNHFNWLAFGLILLGQILYSTSVSGIFLMDDNTYFTENQLFKNIDLWDFKSIFFSSTNYWGEILPLRDYLYVLEYHLFGDNAYGYHIVSLFLYGFAAFVLFRFCLRLFYDYLGYQLDENKSLYYEKVGALIVLSFFLVNPMYVESVAYISGQKDILSFVFVLLSVSFLYRIGFDYNKKVVLFFVIGVLAHYLAVLSKLSALSTIFFIPILWLITSKKSFKEVFKLIVVWIVVNIPVYIWIWYNILMSSEHASVGLKTLSFIERVGRAINIIGIHFKRMLWPDSLTFGYQYSGKFELDHYFLIGLGVLICTVILIYVNRKSLFTLGLALFLCYLLPVLQIYPEMNNWHIYDRYLNVPLIGFFIIIVGVLFRILTKAPRFKWAFYVLIIFISISWYRITYNYIPMFKDNVSAMANLFSHYPDNNEVQFKYASALLANGEFKKVEFLINEKGCLKDPYWVEDYLKGWIALERGNLDLAYKFLFSSVVQANKSGFFPRALPKLIELLMIKKDYELAKSLCYEILNHPINAVLERSYATRILEIIDSLENGIK